LSPTRAAVTARPGWNGPGAAFSRRALLQTGGVAAALLFVPGLRSVARSAGELPAYLRLETYEPLVGSSFAVAGTRRSLRLVAVDRLRHNPDGFSLLFRSRRGERPPAPEIRGVRHPALGPVDLVLLPVGRALHGQTYQSILNPHRPVARKESSNHG